MGAIHSLSGSLRVALTGADLSNSLHAINERNIPISHLQTVDDFTVRFTVLRRYMKEIENIAQRKGDILSVCSQNGAFWMIRDMQRRWVLVFGLLLWISFAVFLPSRVLFLEVEGNERISANQILEAAQDAGIKFGASRRAVRSEKMKNRLLGVLPQLQWAGVNTYGCRAVISVKERNVENQSDQQTISHVVAATDGVITSCIVTNGSGLCAEGQVVQKGQILISGYTDCGGVITAGRGQGEIFALTRHEIRAVSPTDRAFREKDTAAQVRYSLQFGKKRINFYKGSGIYDGSCVKMVTQYYLTLPGDFALPVCLTKEELISYQWQNDQVHERLALEELACFSKRYVRENGVALVIEDHQETVEVKDGLFVLCGHYSCTEMIGREQGVQIGDLHGKTD